MLIQRKLYRIRFCGLHLATEYWNWCWAIIWKWLWLWRRWRWLLMMMMWNGTMLTIKKIAKAENNTRRKRELGYLFNDLRFRLPREWKKKKEKKDYRTWSQWIWKNAWRFGISPLHTHTHTHTRQFAFFNLWNNSNVAMSIIPFRALFQSLSIFLFLFTSHSNGKQSNDPLHPL